jgi:tRNA-dependent cyclodipeptide synthase
MTASIHETFVKVNFRCKNFRKEILKGGACIVHISVGQDYSEGDKFLATMDLINETFSSCKIILCDTLQRHTLQIKNKGLSDEDAYKLAKSLGDEWLERNKPAYQYLTIKNDISRWDDWLHHENYNPLFQEVNQLYLTNDVFRTAVLNTANAFIERNQLDKDSKALDLCLKYIIEETPVLIPLWALTVCGFVVYPRFRTAAMQASYNHFLGEHSHLLKEVALKFNQRVIPKKTSFLNRDETVRET